MNLIRAVHCRLLVAVTVVALLCVAATVLAQRGGFGGRRQSLQILPNPRYDGRFTFVRVRYETAPGGYWDRNLPAWAHGYPRAEQNLMKIMNEVSYLNPHVEEIATLTFDDPELFKYPVAYLIEPGWWTMSEREAMGLRAYLQKGGFVIVDDFKYTGEHGGRGWEAFDENMRRVLPDARFVDVSPSHPIYHSFFDIDSFDIIPQYYNRGRPIFRGLYEDNDPTKRLQMIVNYNTDISQFWEYSATGIQPIDDTNEAFKLGVNYIVYGLTH